MAQGEGFKHITVAPAEDDDVVIHAGIARDDSVSETPGELVEERHEAEEKPAAVAPAPAPKPKPTKPTGSARKRDEYRETTLEDLESIKMSTTQKVVIIAAVVCIIGAIVYWIAFMG